MNIFILSKQANPQNKCERRSSDIVVVLLFDRSGTWEIALIRAMIAVNFFPTRHPAYDRRYKVSSDVLIFLVSAGALLLP